MEDKKLVRQIRARRVEILAFTFEQSRQAWWKSKMMDSCIGSQSIVHLKDLVKMSQDEYLDEDFESNKKDGLNADDIALTESSESENEQTFVDQDYDKSVYSLQD